MAASQQKRRETCRLKTKMTTDKLEFIDWVGRCGLIDDAIISQNLNSIKYDLKIHQKILAIFEPLN
jgi:hypothetical protein